MANPTPGPWGAVPMVNGSKGGFYIVGNRHGNNAETEVATVGPTLSKSAEANARLIAAAPALLEALEAIDKVVSGYKSQMKFCDIEALGYFREFVRRIEATKHAAAIALAKGESA